MVTNYSELNDRCTILRQELKIWEKEFAAAHGGRKAGREDIKANATISQKNKEYFKIREILASKSEPQTPSKTARKRKTTEEPSRTSPKLHADLTKTPTKHASAEVTVPPSAPGSVSKLLLTPTYIRSVIGPTPQKDGLVLGLFDLLPLETPSKAQRTVLGDVVPNIVQTPSKNRGKPEDECSIESHARGSRTPLSPGKRFLLDKFATPEKRKRDEEGVPSSSMNHLSTPMFLRRDTHTLDMITEEDETPRPAPWKRRSLGRSLSSMIQDLKKQEEQRQVEEEERLDEELEIMREMEMEAAGIAIPKKAKAPEILVEDSQTPMKLGPDGFDESDEETDIPQDALDRNGNPRKVWKKRGQKRTTRRVIMRPVITKPRAIPDASTLDDNSDDPEVVQETRSNGHDQNHEDRTGAGEFHEELSDDEGSSDYSNDSHTSKKRKTQHKKAKEPPKKQSKEPTVITEDGSVKKVAKRVSAAAHANFRRLKIKSKAPKGQGRVPFRRRR